LGELPRGQAGALVARPRLVDPDVDRDAGVVRLVDRRQGGAPVDRRQPARVAMGEGVDAVAARRHTPDLGEPVLADAAANLGILVADLGRATVGVVAALAG